MSEDRENSEDDDDSVVVRPEDLGELSGATTGVHGGLGDEQSDD